MEHRLAQNTADRSRGTRKNNERTQWKKDGNAGVTWRVRQMEDREAPMTSTSTITDTSTTADFFFILFTLRTTATILAPSFPLSVPTYIEKLPGTAPRPRTLLAHPR